MSDCLIEVKEPPRLLFAETAPDQRGSGRAHHRITANTQTGPLSPHLAPVEVDRAPSVANVCHGLATVVQMTIDREHNHKLVKVRGALSDAILNSAYFWQMATDERGVIQIFNVGAERMLGYDALDVVDRITHADMSDPQELISRAAELSAEPLPPLPRMFTPTASANRRRPRPEEMTLMRARGNIVPVRSFPARC